MMDGMSIVMEIILSSLYDAGNGTHKILTYNNFNGGLGDRYWNEGRKDMWAYNV